MQNTASRKKQNKREEKKLLYLLETSVTVDINKLPFEIQVLLISAGLVLAAIIFINGVSFRIGEKEMNLGGIRRLLEKKEEDTLLKEALKKFSDDVDHEVTANLYDLVGVELEEYLEPPLVMGEHCYFTFEKFSELVKSELYKRIRRNSLWEKLTTGKDSYTTTILKDIETRYDQLQKKVSHVKCGDTYQEFPVIKEDIRNLLYKFFDKTVEILVKGMEKKIEEYEKKKPEFKTTAARKICCDDCIAKNQSRIKKLNGMGNTKKEGEKE